MQIDTLTVLYIFYFISIILYAISVVLESTLVLPLQFRENTVNDSLKPLRAQMLAKGILSITVAITSILALTSRYLGFSAEVNRLFIVVIVTANAIGVLGKAYLDYRIYHQDYYPFAKSLHNKSMRGKSARL